MAALIAEAPPLLLNVLLVEDESVVAEDVQDALDELGCRVIGWATTAADAERLAASHAPDVILMDVKLKGGVDGIEAASRLRTRHRAPIIFASGVLDGAMRERIRQVPSSTILQKPYSLTELQAALDWARGQIDWQALPI